MSLVGHEYPVLVVGGGPIGLLSAYMLAKLGGNLTVETLLIEKYPQRLAAPKAHVICPRSLEICRQYGLDTNSMRKIGSPRDEAYWVNFLTNLSGKLIGNLPFERMDPGVLESVPEMIHNIPQPSFEQFILAEILHSCPEVDMRKNLAFVSCEQDGDSVISLLEDRSSKTQLRIKSKHVVACDGAKSQVRKFLGIESEGEDVYDTMMTIHFKADLRPVVKERVGTLHWIIDPACSGFIIAYDLSGDHVLINNFDAKKQPSETWTPDIAKAVVSAAIGQDIPLEILSFRPWVLSRKVAKEYRRGNVFLVGDAVHAFPPTGGLGLNTGIADAHNLAYKLAAVHRGSASDFLLQTYEAERRPVALRAASQSVKNGKRIFSFLRNLGAANIGDLVKARANLYQTVYDPTKQQMISEGVEEQREHFNNLGIHIGYIYGSTDLSNDASLFTPKFVVGARLPHAWIRLLNLNRQHTGIIPIDVSYVKELPREKVKKWQYSTLDLCSFQCFTLITSSRQSWSSRCKALAEALGQWGVRIEMRAADCDFEFVEPIQRELFNQGAAMNEGGALLVRPDQHILGCLSPETNFLDLVTLVKSHLGLC
ncbi:FAD binding domain-containing protein [Camillea tinctor]|nr:FAD binding domain-containing protein [Camillea tinctor]